MPVAFDIIGLVNNVREPMNHDGDDLEDNPFVTDEENPLLRMDSIGRVFTRSKTRATNRSKSNYFANDQTVRFNLSRGKTLNIGLIEETNEDTAEGEQEEDVETENKIEDRKFLMAWNVRPISVKNLNEEIIQNFEEIEDELKIELSKFGKFFVFYWAAKIPFTFYATHSLKIDF